MSCDVATATGVTTSSWLSRLLLGWLLGSVMLSVLNFSMVTCCCDSMATCCVVTCITLIGTSFPGDGEAGRSDAINVTISTNEYEIKREVTEKRLVFYWISFGMDVGLMILIQYGIIPFF